MPADRIDTLVRRVLEAREDYETKRKAKVKAEKRKHAVEADLHEELERQNMPGSKVEIDGERVGVARVSTIRGRIIDRDVAVKALTDEGKADGYTFTDLRKGAINDLVRECLESGEPIPEGLDFNETKFVRITRSKP